MNLSDYKDPQGLLLAIHNMSDQETVQLPESLFKEIVEKTHDKFNCTLLSWACNRIPCVVEGSYNAYFWGMQITDDGSLNVIIRVTIVHAVESLEYTDDTVSFPFSMFVNGCEGLTPTHQLYYLFRESQVARSLKMMLYEYVRQTFNYDGLY